MKNKYVVASAFALAMSVGLATSPKAQASSSAKYTIKQYRTVKKYKHGMKATFSYQLPQLKGNSAAVKKINKDLKKSYNKEKKNSKNIFKYAKKDGISGFNSNGFYFDTVRASITYNTRGIISIRKFHRFFVGGSGEYTISGWTYSLKTGKRLTIFDVAEGDENSIALNFVKGALQLGADINYLKKTYPSDLNFFLKKGKVYIYPRLSSAEYSDYVVIPSRYK